MKKKISEMTDEEIRLLNKSRDKSIDPQKHEFGGYEQNPLFEKTIKIYKKDLYPRTGRHTKSIKQLGKYKETSKGVYIFWYNDDVVYVGQSKTLQPKLSVHKTMNNSWAWNYISWLPEKIDGERFMIESYLIRLYKPKYNIIGIE